MPKASTYLIIVLGLSLAGCYHARIETGAPPSGVTVENNFASGWIYGLVPPSTVETADRCPNGVAVVETQLSFVNQLVSALTLGIYSPMTIQVTCAAAGTAHLPSLEAPIRIPAEASSQQVRTAFASAGDRAVATRAPVLVQIER